MPGLKIIVFFLLVDIRRRSLNKVCSCYFHMWRSSTGSRVMSLPILAQIHPVVWEKNGNRQTDRETDRQTERQTERLTD